MGNITWHISADPSLPVQHVESWDPAQWPAKGAVAALPPQWLTCSSAQINQLSVPPSALSHILPKISFLCPFSLSWQCLHVFQCFCSIWCFFYVLPNAFLLYHHPPLIFPGAILLFHTQPIPDSIPATVSSADIFLRGNSKYTEPFWKSYSLFSCGSFSDIFFFSFFFSGVLCLINTKWLPR